VKSFNVLSLVHIVKILTFYLRRYGQNCPYCRKIEEIYKKRNSCCSITSLLPRFPLERLSCHVCEDVCCNCDVNVGLATLTSLLPRFPLERRSCHVFHWNVSLATFLKMYVAIATFAKLGFPLQQSP
jgi:hypothetical protein